ncbi:MAG: hypothetical protein AMS27_01450 [Bacteroides sp. SM23_62_1]|nr:MAG: hypothetical protein AMS27_01450 [Bacteroides sp. SM23_62_1]
MQKRTLDFLVVLKKNNNRQWFQNNKPWYEEARKDFIGFIELLALEIGKFDPAIGQVNPREAMFRIYRDIRFSKDKSPYKANMGAHIVPGGKKSGLAGYYFHIEPGDCFLAGGIYMPLPEILKKVRREIYENIEEFLSIIENKKFLDYFGKIWGEQLVNPPAGYPKDFENINLLKYKNYTVLHSIPEDILFGNTLLNEVIYGFKLMYPFNKFINYAITGNL